MIRQSLKFQVFFVWYSLYFLGIEDRTLHEMNYLIPGKPLYWWGYTFLPRHKTRIIWKLNWLDLPHNGEAWIYKLRAALKNSVLCSLFQVWGVRCKGGNLIIFWFLSLGYLSDYIIVLINYVNSELSITSHPKHCVHKLCLHFFILIVFFT